MADKTQPMIRNPWVPASLFPTSPLTSPLSQVGDYELDLLKLGFFGWMNVATIASELWLQQLATVPLFVEE